MKLNQVINVEAWHQRNLSVGYGTRDKTVLKKTKKGRIYYLAKTYDKDIGELRSEVSASNIGRLFSFPVQKTWLCAVPQYKKLKLKHPLGVLIQLDVRRQKETRRNRFREDLKHGAALISLVSKEFSKLKDETERRKAYTLDIVVKALRAYVEKHPEAKVIWEQFFDLLVFDALIGGTDRHYNNWGVLEKADNGSFLRLAPAFDNGVSLMWKMDEYKAKFMKDLMTRKFPTKAESMFKKTNGGKYSLFEVLEAFYKLGDFANDNVIKKNLDRLRNIKASRITSVILNNVSQKPKFRTKKEDLGLVAEYAKIRLDILKETLSKLLKNKNGSVAL